MCNENKLSDHPPKNRCPPPRRKKNRVPAEQTSSSKASPSKQQLKNIIAEKDKNIKILKQKIRRKETKIKSLSQLVDELKKKKLVSEVAAEQLEEAFSGVSSDIIVNHFKNKDRRPRGYRHSE